MLAPTGTVFRDCTDCPEMVVLPAGRFWMGSPAREVGRESREGPQREVSVPQPFAVSRYLITAAEYRVFLVATGHRDPGYCWILHDHDGAGTLEWFEITSNSKLELLQGSERHPVTCVNWHDALQFTAWMSRRTGYSYRLLTEAEWEYAARAATQTRFWWGSSQSDQCLHANGADISGRSGFDWDVAHCRDGFVRTNPVDHFPPNGFSLHDMACNVKQWVMDCFRETFAQAPTIASQSVQLPQCRRRVLRGGSWADEPSGLRLAIRDQDLPDARSDNIGFRIARSSGGDRR